MKEQKRISKTIYDHIPLTFDKEDIKDTLKNKVLIIVNTASACGFAKEADAKLSMLADKYHKDGLRILLFPCNQFGRQESGDICKVADNFWEMSKHLIFFEKIDVNGKNEHPLYKHLKEGISNSIWGSWIKWNYTKFVVDKQGNVVKRYGPMESVDEKFIRKSLGFMD